MAHPNERAFLAAYLVTSGEIDGPILEVGSKQYGHGIDYRPLFPGREVIGIDIEKGPGVDHVWDLAAAPINLPPFAGVLCVSVLEHCAAPWKMAEHILTALAKGGLLYVAVPWIWRSHAYPKDYWRLSADGVRALFGDAIDWQRVQYATQQKGEFFNEGTDFNGAPWRQIQGQRVALVSQMVCMVGIKR